MKRTRDQPSSQINAPHLRDRKIASTADTNGGEAERNERESTHHSVMVKEGSKSDPSNRQEKSVVKRGSHFTRRCSAETAAVPGGVENVTKFDVARRVGPKVKAERKHVVWGAVVRPTA